MKTKKTPAPRRAGTADVSRAVRRRIAAIVKQLAQRDPAALERWLREGETSRARG